MNALARYLLVFLLGWSGAVFSYSDIIYQKNKIPLNQEIDKKADESLLKTTDDHLAKNLKLPTTLSDEFIKKKIEEEPKP